MRTAEMRRTITNAIDQENQTRYLDSMLRRIAIQNRTSPNQQDIAGVVNVCQEYVSAVPELLEEAEEAARSGGILDEFQPLIASVEQYWFEAIDIFPDHQGLVGLVDDAYVALSVTQGASTQFAQRTGRPLITQDLTIANRNIRDLIGEPFASQLDAFVGNALAAPAIQGWLNQIMSRVNAFPLNTPHPIWGPASTDEIVTAQLGAMGIFPGRR